MISLRGETLHHCTAITIYFAFLNACVAACRYMGRTQKEAAEGVVPLLFISFPSAKDPLWADKHPGKSTATIVTFANYDWFKEVGELSGVLLLVHVSKYCILCVF